MEIKEATNQNVVTSDYKKGLESGYSAGKNDVLKILLQTMNGESYAEIAIATFDVSMPGEYVKGLNEQLEKASGKKVILIGVERKEEEEEDGKTEEV